MPARHVVVIGASIGIVLSGHMAGGAHGLLVIKQSGGTAIVQDPEQAQVPSMPRSAIRLVNVDHVLPVEEMAGVVTDLVMKTSNAGSCKRPAAVRAYGDARGRARRTAAEKKFNLIQSDIGRPFSQIRTTLQCPELPSLITETIDTVSPVERTVQDDKGDSYVLRIRPYKTPDTRIDGAVIALFDLNGKSDK